MITGDAPVSGDVSMKLLHDLLALRVHLRSTD
jgi:hypothetical protein